MSNRFHENIRRIGDIGVTWAAAASSACIAPIPVILSYEVAARYFFNSPTIWAWDLALQFGGAAMMLGAPHALKNGVHIRLDLLTRGRSPAIRGLLELIGAVTVIASASVLIWLGFIEALRSTVEFERMSTIWGPPIFILRWTLPISGLLLFYVGVERGVSGFHLLCLPRPTGAK